MTDEKKARAIVDAIVTVTSRTGAVCVRPGKKLTTKFEKRSRTNGVVL